MSSSSIAKKLADASKAYYESGKLVMTDAEYDTLKEKLESLDPDHPFLQQVGAPVSEGAVTLPHHMPSLRKIKPDTLSSVKLQGPFLMSEKLDGVSALWVCGMNKKSALYLRGDGNVGQDVSHILKHIKGLRTCGITYSVAVRGELIVPKATVPAARNWVNGLIHQKSPSPEDLSKIHFVAYSVYEPKNLTRTQQMTWLTNQGFEVAWYMALPKLDASMLSLFFKERRTESIYECDGIVLGTDTVPHATTDATPKDAFAYKEASEDQAAETTVLAVEYASSRTGSWIPRIRVEPVQIGNATIEYCTGIHAKFIKENIIGPGARVIIRRSGDVIPKLDKVLIPAKAWAEPPAGRWAWDETGVNATDTSQEIDFNKYAQEMVHSLVAFGVERVSEASALKLVEAGFKTIQNLSKAREAQLQAVLGPTNGKNLKDSLTLVLNSSTELKWLHAYPSWPKGFGERKIQATLEAQSDVFKWPQMTSSPKGQTMKTFEEVQKAVPAYLKWRAEFGPLALRPVVAPQPPPAHVATKGTLVMTGFRDTAIQKRLEDAGYKMVDSVSKSTTILLVADGGKETTKVKSAREAGVRIVPRSKIDELF